MIEPECHTFFLIRNNINASFSIMAQPSLWAHVTAQQLTCLLWLLRLSCPAYHNAGHLMMLSLQDLLLCNQTHVQHPCTKPSRSMQTSISGLAHPVCDKHVRLWVGHVPVPLGSRGPQAGSDTHCPFHFAALNRWHHQLASCSQPACEGLKPWG